MKAGQILETVVSAHLREGCTGLTRGTRSRWWELTLECGCVVERPARYKPLGMKWQPKEERLKSDVLPAPLKAACERYCKVKTAKDE